jgi:predicted AAA+ superfamily ATPase
MVVREFWINRLRQVWERAPIAWLAGVRRVGKTTLARSLPEAECFYVNCDSPRAAQTVADPEFYSEWLDSHFARDVQELFGIAKRAGYMALLQVLLRQSGGLLDITKLASQTALSRPTVMHYLEVCETTLTVCLVRPYHAGKAREWTHQPKAYAFDTGFICHARGWENLRAEDCGGLWEHLVLDTLLSVEDPAKVMFWRDHQQREVDFVVPRGREAVDAYECKWTGLQPDVRNLKAFRQAYPQGRNFLVVPQRNATQTLRLEGLILQVISPSGPDG